MRFRLLASGVALALLVGPLAAGRAATSRPPKKNKTAAAAKAAAAKAAKDARVTELQGLVGEASDQEGALVQEITAIRARLDDLDDAVRRLSRETAAARRRQARAQRDLDQAEAEKAQVALRLAQTQAEVEAARQALNQTVTALYQRGTSEDQAIYLAVVEGASSARDVFAASRYLAGSLNEDRRQLEHFLALKTVAESLARLVESRTEEARVARDQLAADTDRIEALRVEAVANRTAARAEEDREADLLREVQDRKADFERELNALVVESSAIGEMLRQLQAGQKLAPRRRRTFKAPVAAPISSRFGPRVHPIFGDVRMHTGVDYAAGDGLPIRAAGGGTVVWAGPRGGYGNVVIIDHRKGLATLYAHQSDISVTLGQPVLAGEVIGYVGRTGLATGPHLHFETREFGAPVDPLIYL